LRASGRIPAVIYGRQIQPQNLEFSSLDLTNLIKHSLSENILLDLKIQQEGASNRLALVKSIQHHPLSGQVLHVDLHEVSENEKVIIQVPVEAVGEAVGVKQNGGVLEHVLFKLRVRAFPKDLPEVIEVDVSHMDIGQTIHLGDIKVPEGVELLGDKHISVLSVAAPISEAEEQAELEAAAAAAGDVEMIKEKKEEGEGEAGAAAPGAKGAAAAPGAKGAAAAPAAKGAAAAKPAAGEKAATGVAAAPAAEKKPGGKK
jgi:large subunit ribosomal protein L25